ncbi:alpha/beta hydrolase [Kutzneria viridogrisea]|uniref:Alpha/beta hydrolase n=2 Tax=Kutzneria TaxID=43356 RepID=W5VYM5_9PSEU|nr:alpha/beta hydrolase [Kutzneria albida]AHH93652.1 alpha/beta hydrolase [Kutzneria albida DSM 43870]MBA8928964.1 acetyl esterase [Kutzneria viridogrisea]MBA8931344.1 acetyl esterase [Kutzneria viridogrisea]
MAGLGDSIPMRWQAKVVRGLFALPRPVRRLLAGKPVWLDGQQLDLDAQLLLKLQKLSGTELLNSTSAARARASLDASRELVSGEPIQPVDARDLLIPSPEGDIRARLYRPARLPEGSPLLIYFHGGGFAIGSVDSHDNLCRFLAKHSGVRVLSVDYRLAPEAPFPAAVEDCLTAFKWAVAEADSLGIDPKMIALGGDSAGGNLAIVTAQQATSGARPIFVLAFYPTVDATADTASRKLFGEGFFLTGKAMDWFMEQYAPDPDTRTDPRMSPLLAGDLSGLPPMYLATAGFDPLRDEGEQFAQRVAEAGVPVVLRRHEGLIHGYASMTGIGQGFRDAVFEAAGALRTGLAIGRNGRPRRKSVDPAELHDYPVGNWLT